MSPPSPAEQSLSLRSLIAVARATPSKAPAAARYIPELTWLTCKKKQRLETLFATDEDVEVEPTGGVHQRMIAAYSEPDRERGRELMRQLIDSVSRGFPAALTEVITLGRTLKKRAADILAYFDRPSTSTGPTKAMTPRNTSAAPASGSAT